MKPAIFTAVLLSLVSSISASAPMCKQQGHSLQLPNGTFPFNVFTWTNINSVPTCQQLCLAQEGCYAYAHSAQYQQCHGYDEIVGLVQFTPNATSGWDFYDICCSV